MGSSLPELEREAFVADLLRVSPLPLTASALEGLWRHYLEMARWNPRLSLIGPGTADEVVPRHYGESLAALPLLRTTDRSLVDLGSGGGFPGLVLAIARPSLDVVLVEPKQRKWSFLQSASRRVREAGAALSCRVLDARVSNPLPATLELPETIDVFTCRALALGPSIIEILGRRFPGVRFLLWSGQEISDRLPGYGTVNRLRLDGSDRHWLVELAPLNTDRLGSSRGH